MRWWLVLTLLATLAIVGGTGPDATAAGDTVTPLNLIAFWDMVADPAHGHAFITQGPNTDEVVVADQTGQVVTTLQDLPGASGMVLSPDGSTLYVALHGASAIAAIDTRTFDRTLLPTGSGTCPLQLAVAAGLVWFTSDCDNPQSGRDLDAIDPTTGAVYPSLYGLGAQQLASAPTARPNLLFVRRGQNLIKLRVTGAPSPTATETASRDLGNAFADMALTPDGDRVVVVGGPGMSANVFGADHLAEVDSYPADMIPNAVAVSPTGAVAVGTDDYYDYDTDVFVYAPGQTVVSARHDFGNDPNDYNAPEKVDESGLAFGDGKLFVVTSDQRQTTFALRVLDATAPARAPTGSHHVHLPSFFQILADPREHREFLSSGPEGNGVAVADASGRVITVLGHMPGSSQMVLDAAHHIVYVALEDGDAIAAINTRTLNVRKLSTGAAKCPSSVAVARGLVWFGYGCYAGPGPNGVGSYDPRTGRIHLGLYAVGNYLLFASPVHPHELFASEAFDARNGDLLRFHITGPTRPSAILRNRLYDGPKNQDVALSPDGLHVLLAPPCARAHPVLDADTLAVDGFDAREDNPVAVAVRSDGLVADGISWFDDPGLPTGIPASKWDVAVRRFAFGPDVAHVFFPPHVERHFLQPRGLAFGQRALYTVTQHQDNVDTPPYFHLTVHRMPRLRPLSLSVGQPVGSKAATIDVVAHVLPSVRSRAGVVSVYSQRTASSRWHLVARGHPDRFGNLHARALVGRHSSLMATAGKSGRVLWRTRLSQPTT